MSGIPDEPDENPPLKKAETTADWSVSLICECPHCKETVDLLDEPDFWDGRTLEVCEKRKDVEVWCPECNEQFVVDTEY